MAVEAQLSNDCAAPLVINAVEFHAQPPFTATALGGRVTCKVAGGTRLLLRAARRCHRGSPRTWSCFTGGGAVATAAAVGSRGGAPVGASAPVLPPAGGPTAAAGAGGGAAAGSGAPAAAVPTELELVEAEFAARPLLLPGDSWQFVVQLECGEAGVPLSAMDASGTAAAVGSDGVRSR